jgi:hypothetical protein
MTLTAALGRTTPEVVMAEWSRVVNTTISDYVKGEEVNILRNRKLLALLKSRGRITFNHAGDRRHQAGPVQAGPDDRVRGRGHAHLQPAGPVEDGQLDWRGYSVTDAMTKKERLMNKSTSRSSTSTPTSGRRSPTTSTTSSARSSTSTGTRPATPSGSTAIESFFGAGSVCMTNGYVVHPSDTYANLRPDLGYYGGAWATSGGNVTWPTGTGDAHYDFWSPLLVSLHQRLVRGLDGHLGEQLRGGPAVRPHQGKKNKTKTGMTRLHLARRRDVPAVPRGHRRRSRRSSSTREGRERPAGSSRLGFTDVTYFDGCEVTYEYGMPSGVGYGLNVDQMELMSLQGQLFVVEGPGVRPPDQVLEDVDRLLRQHVGNPRYQFKLLAAG